MKRKKLSDAQLADRERAVANNERLLELAKKARAELEQRGHPPRSL